MNLADKEILELTDLCNAVVEGTLTEKEKSRLSHWLVASEEARGYYVRTLGLSASLYSYAGEMHAEVPDVRQWWLRQWWSQMRQPRLWRWFAPLAAAASVVTALWIFSPPQRSKVSVESKPDEYVARLTGSKESRWVHGSAALQPGDHVRKGQRLELAAGFAEITFDCGAQVVLEGPTTLEVVSAWETTLRNGTVKAIVPPEAIGFSVSHPAVEIVDLGTDFSMIADASGSADVFVLKGAVEATPRAAANQQTIVLRENEARRFAPSGVTDVDDSELKFARLTQLVPLDRFVQPANCVYWSFDEADQNQIQADSGGLVLSVFDAPAPAASGTWMATVLTDGRSHRALRFDGRLFAKAAFPGISGGSPHTLAFWVKVPKDAQLSEAYAMIAWAAESKKRGSFPVHIDWNRNPTEGALGVLRTDYAGGFAIGATPLRDGRWHHIAVVYVPGGDAETAVDVKQYVDGRLEGEGRPSPPGKTGGSTVGDTIWLGCRLGNDGPRKERFRGEIDDLFIADCALGPREIVSLMKNNQLPQFELADAKP